jgi:hypothetical protein
MEALLKHKTLLGVLFALIVVGFLLVGRFLPSTSEQKVTNFEPIIQVEKLLVTENEEYLTLEQEEVPAQSKIAFRVNSKIPGLVSLTVSEDNSPPRVLITKMPIPDSKPTLLLEGDKPWVHEIDNSGKELRFCILIGKDDKELEVELKKLIADEMALAECARVVPVL